MGRLIDADLLMEAYLQDKKSGAVSMVKLIEEAPTVEKHGHWYDEPNYLGTSKTMFFCSVCGSASWREDPYCWHCGTKMDVSDTNVGKTEEVKK